MAKVQTIWVYKTRLGIPPSEASRLKTPSKGGFRRIKIKIPNNAKNLLFLVPAGII